MIPRVLALLLLAVLLIFVFAARLPIVVPTNYFMEVAKGNVPGESAVEVAGENVGLPSNGDLEDVWDGSASYVPPTQARLHNISSTLAADAGTVVSSGTATGGSATTLIDSGADFSPGGDNVSVGDAMLNDANVEICAITTVAETTLTCAGGIRSPDTGLVGVGNAAGEAYRIVTNASTGASLVWMDGLNAFFLEQDEFVVLNGQSDVASAKSYIRMHMARAFGPGSTDVAGNISAETIGEVAETDTWIILNGNNQTLMAIRTVPADKIGYIVQWWSSLSRDVANATSHVHLRAGTFGGFKYSVQPRAINTVGSSLLGHMYVFARPIPGGSDIWIEASANAVNVGVSAGFGILLVDN